MDRGTILRGIGYGIAALLLNTLIALLWVFFYSVAVAPGHGGDFYQAYAQRVAPVAGLIAGVLLLMAAGYLTARRSRDWRAAALPAAAYIILDLLLMAMGKMWAPAGWLALSYLAMAAAAIGGGWLAARPARAQ